MAGVQIGISEASGAAADDVNWKWMQCCQMIVEPDEIDTMAQAKLFVMDMTLMDIAKQAGQMGYQWIRGCDTQYVGENFVRNGNIWSAERGDK